MSSTMFLPWLRTGLAGYLPAPVGEASPADPALTLAVALTDAGAAQPTHEHTVMLRGPGHVVALAPRVVTREEPPRQARDVAPTTFPHVELREPDLPWRHTPVGVDANGRLPPWIVLVCVRLQDGVALRQDPRTQRPALHVAGARVADELPDLRESWAWAHVQVSGVADGEDPIGDGKHAPDHAIARLVCPRRLQPFARYVCAVVPAYRAGIEAARGDVPTTTDRTPAWSSADPQDVVLPTLHCWSFTTGEAGDFETLARRMLHRRPPANLGERPLTLLPLGLREPEPVAEGTTVPLRGSLRAPPKNDTPVEQATPPAVAQRLAGLWTVEQHGDDDPVVTPPQYAVASVTGQAPPWLAQLNHHPAHRTAAGLGAEVVLRHQEELVAAAWDQLEQARSAAVMLRQTQLAAEIGRTQARRLADLPAGDAWQLTARAHARITDANGTLIRTRLLAEGLPDGALSPRMRRWTRPGAPTVRRRGAIPAKAIAGRNDAKPRATSLAGRFVTQLLAAPTVMQRAAGWVRPHGLGRVAAPTPRTPKTRVTEALTLSLRPLAAHFERMQARLGGTTAVKLVAEDGLPDALRLMPQFDVPLSRWLVDVDPELILPGLGDMADDSILVLAPNRPFVEAVLAGANDALIRELAWREFPVDPRGTAFRVFWEGADGYDIRPLAAWKHTLGAHTATEQANAVGAAVLLRGALLRRYPNLRIYLGRPGPTKGSVDVAPPIGCGRLTSDTSYALFAATPEALERDWWLVLEEVPGATRFGLDDVVTGAPAEDSVAWPHFGAALHAPAARPARWGTALPQWGRDSGALASLTLQRPIRYAVRLAELLAPGDA